MRIGIFIRSLSKGGAEKQALLLTEYLSNYYPTSLFVFYHSRDELSYKSIQKSSIIFIKGNNILSKTLCFYQELKRNRITHLFNYLPINNIIGIIIGKLVGIKYIFGGIRGDRYKNPFKMLLQKFLCNYIASGFISNSRKAKETYSNYGMNSKKIQVVSNAINLPQKFIKKINDKTMILSVGRFIYEKDYETAINSIAYLLKKHPEIYDKIIYNIVGYGKLKEQIYNYILNKKLERIIHVHQDSELSDLYQQSDILLNTSLYEGMPNVIMEGMSYGLSIVATDAGDSSLLVRPNRNGMLCGIKDYKNIGNALYELISDYKLIQKMGEESKKIIIKEYLPEKVFSKYVKIINNGIHVE